jgi:4-amino-4-deoxy-L-arabinose transferase-like glycosyltransferase
VDGSASVGVRTPLLLVVGLTLAVRLGMLVHKWDRPLELNDSLWYSAQAVVVARGDGFTDPFVGGPSAEHGPLTPVLLAVVSWVDHPVPWQRLVMTLLGVVTVGLIGLVGVRLGGRRTGLVAAGLAAVYPPLWINDSLVMSETPAVLLVTLACLLSIDIVDGRRRRRVPAAVLLGVVIGLAALTRSELLLLAPLLATVIVRLAPVEGGARWRPGVLLVVAAGTTLLPWVIPNLLRFERPVLLTTNDGTTLLGANCEDSWTGPDIGGWSLFCVFDSVGPEGEDPSERSARQRREAMAYVADHPTRAPLVVAARLGRAVDLVGVPNLIAGDVGEERDRWAAWTGVVAWWLLAVPAALGIRSLPGRQRAVLLMPVVSVAVTTVLFYGGHRIRSPLEPVVVLGAAVWIVGRLDRRRSDTPVSAPAEVTP